MSSHDPSHNEEEDLMDAADVGEEVDGLDEDVAMEEMDGDDDDEPIVEGGGVEEALELQNDSIAHFDGHSDSVFSIAAHPKAPLLVVTGSGDDSAFVWSADPQPDLLPRSFQQGSSTAGDAGPGRESLRSIAQLKGHKDTVIATAFTKPNGDYLLTAGMDGKLRVFTAGKGGIPARDAAEYKLAVEVEEVEEASWLAVCPSPDRPNVFALGASDGSVWVYEIVGGSGSGSASLQIIQTYYQHTSPTTAGTWSANGALLATVSEESSLYVYDPFGLVPDAAAPGTGAVVALTAADQRFAVEGGLYSVTITPGGTLCAVGGHSGSLRVVSLPRTGADPAAPAAGTTKGQKGGAGARAKSGGAAQAGGSGQAGQIVASLSTGGDSVETLAFSPTGALLAAGDVDGNLRIFETGRNFALRKHIPEAHENQAVVALAWEGAGSAQNDPAAASTVFYSCGMDGVLKKWDARAGTLLKEFKGHRGGGEGGGIMGFVLVKDDEGKQLAVTAGDDGVSLVFDTTT